MAEERLFDSGHSRRKKERQEDRTGEEKRGNKKTSEGTGREKAQRGGEEGQGKDKLNLYMVQS